MISYSTTAMEASGISNKILYFNYCFYHFLSVNYIIIICYCESVVAIVVVYILGSDYYHQDGLLVISNNSSIVIQIVDDNIFESYRESFLVVLSTNDSRISLAKNQSIATVSIRDNESKLLSLTH